MSTTRRLFLYIITLIALSVTASGLGQLISLLLNLAVRSPAQVGGAQFNYQQLSLGVAMIVIGTPLWFFFWRSIQRRTSGSATETGSFLRKFYLNLILLVTAIVALTGIVTFFAWLIGGANREVFEPGAVASFLVGGSIWAYHRQVSEREGQPSSKALTLRRWYVYILSAFSLVWFATAIIELISAGIVTLPLWGQEIVSTSFWTGVTQSATARIIFSGLAWYFHWFKMAKGDNDSTLRQVYFYLFTITGGAIAALTAAAVTIQRTITWALGGTPAAILDNYFQFLGWTIPTVIIGIAIWGYHQRLAHEESANHVERRRSSERIHLYLMSFLGLGTMSAGLIFLFAVIINLAIGIAGRSITPGTGWWQSLLALSISMLAVGTPLWLYYWGKVLKITTKSGIEESRASSRRIFLYAVVIIALGTLIADFVNIVYQIINGILQSNTNYILRESRWSIQTLIVAAPVLWYHWRIIRIDQKRGSEVSSRKIVTLFTYDRTGDLASRLEGKLGYRVKVLAGVGTGGQAAVSEEELIRIASEIETAPAATVAVISAGGNLMVMPYEKIKS